ncbi:helix-turn-helix domain-containing protein [Enterococcus gilvus]|uniref:helix-turn-helix domain-containing protein n=1 Tax=Enterococcus gilvus TaxID=160453 RepID=UPI003EDB09F7
MKPFVLLTKNILYEVTIQQQIQQLNYEVFNSSKLLEEWLSEATKQTYLQLFSVVIISETISKKESQALFPLFSEQQIPVIRLGKHHSMVDDTQKPEAEEMIAWLSYDCSMEELRETFQQVLSLNETQGLQERTATGAAFTQAMLQLSKNEQKVLTVLMEKSEQIVSRSELSECIWGTFNHSTRAQLSTLVGRINTKFQQIIFGRTVIQTYWGRGYFIDVQMHSFVQPYLDKKSGPAISTIEKDRPSKRSRLSLSRIDSAEESLKEE